MRWPNHSVQSMGASRSAHCRFLSQCRLPRVAHNHYSAERKTRPRAVQISKIIILLRTALLCASAGAADQFKTGSGDVGSFILEKAVAAGAAPVSTNEVLRVTEGWRYFQDDKGVVVHMAPADYSALEAFLLHTFGRPKVGPKDTPSGGKYGTYRLTAKGGVLQFGRDAEDGTHVEIVRPLTRQETADAAARASKDPQVRKELSKP